MLSYMVAMMMAVGVAAQDKAVVRFYGESMCPGCQVAVAYLSQSVWTVDGVTDIIDFEYVAYGNAAGVPPNVECQHGAPECLGNMAEECAKNQTGGDPLKYMPFVACLEAGQEITNAGITTCAGSASLDAADINSCLTDGRGDTLIAAAAKNTPDHDYVPYFTFNGKALNNYEHIISKACKYWKGTAPAFCSSTEDVKPVCMNQN